jgi:hypothetical protein
MCLGMASWACGCGPAFAPPSAAGQACRTIGQRQFDQAIASGATVARAKIHANGVVSMSTGMGSKQCSSLPKSSPTCVRSNDLVIEYRFDDNTIHYNYVPKNTQYRFTLHAKPTPCEVIVGY